MHGSGKQCNQMARNFMALAARIAPLVFVVLWSTGFIGTKAGLNHAEPMTFFALRVLCVVAILTIIAAVIRPPFPDRMGTVHSLVTGALVHGFYLGGVAVAIHLSVPAGLSALIPGLQPVLTSTIASRFMGERVTPLQWGGLILGLVGVALVLHDRPLAGTAIWGWVASFVSLLGITLGTLYQKKFGGGIDWRAGNIFQYLAAFTLFAIGSMLFETRVIDWSVEFFVALTWLVFVLSIGTVALMYWLIRRSGNTEFASLFYLVPAVTSVFAWLLFGETLDAISIAGMVVATAGVFVVNWKVR